MRIIRKLADNNEMTSLASQARQRRFVFFHQLLDRVPRPIRILDVGGTQRFWEVMRFADSPGVEVTLLNVSPQRITRPNFVGLVGDATNMTCFPDKSFDVCFSNSVIEHVGDFSNQIQMAQEVQRVGIRYFIQTPNYYFPIEPHFLFFGFQWLPVSVRVMLLQKYDLGWMKRRPDRRAAEQDVRGIRLLKRQELSSLFPDAQLFEERLFGFTKSFVAYGGWS